MRIPVSWLRDYVKFDLPVEEVARRLTMAGLEVESIERVGGDWSGVVVGHVKAVNPHPNADRLRLVTVDTGSQTVEVVCGAPNVAEGQKIAYAAVGASLIDGHTGKPAQLKPAKIRGVVSNGMVCSERELGLSDEHEGILVLDPAVRTGMALSDLIGDSILDIKVSPNRSDCLSVLGVAREVGTLVGTPATPPPSDYPETGEAIGTFADVRIGDPDLCARYTATVITGVNVGPSPQWLADRIRSLGQNPINNIVDITNYVMFETGQPLHAFNLREVRGRTVLVRRAKPGEKLMPLDGVERTLPADTLVIADAERPIGLAGVMGGLRSGINADTKDIFLESANFDAANSRRTQSALSLRTEATLRFEKALRPELAEHALKRATKLIHELTGGTVAKGRIDVWPGKAGYDPSVAVSKKRLKQVLGVEYPDAQVLDTLRSLGCGVTAAADGAGWNVVPPYWRTDITIPEDVAEELARIIGYDAIPTTVIGGELPKWTPNPRREVRERVRDALAGCGLQEIVNYPLTTEEALARVRPPAGPTPLRVANPLSSDLSALRTTLREAVLRVAARNSHTWRGPVALFECARVYLDRGEGLPEERESAVGVLLGPRSDVHWSRPASALDYFDARGVVETMLRAFGLEAQIAPVSDATFSPGRAASVAVGGRRLGVVGEVAPDILRALDCDATPVALFELDVDGIVELTGARQAAVQYTPFGRFPDSVRDLSIVIDDSVPAGSVLAAARRAKLVVDATVFDLYRGAGLPAGKKALGLRIVYRSSEKTLTSEEIERTQGGILRGLEHDFGAVLRA